MSGERVGEPVVRRVFRSPNNKGKTMRSGTEKAAAVVGIAVVAAALWGAGYWQGGRSARTLTDGSTAKTTQDEEKTPVLTVARDLPIAENDAIPGV